jgi:hypothetical protein
VLIAIVLLVVYPTPQDWRPTYDTEDKIPRGTLIFHDWMLEEFGEERVYYSFEDIETRGNTGDSLMYKGYSWIFIQETFLPTFEKWKAIDSFCQMGGVVFASSGYANLESLDSISLYISRGTGFFNPSNVIRDTSKNLIHLDYGNGKVYEGRLSRKLSNSYIYAGQDSLVQYDVLGWNNLDDYNLVRIPKGNGYLYLHSIPDVFSNYAILNENVYEYLGGLISLLPREKIIFDRDFYDLSSESRSPFRAMLRNDSLRWMYFLLLSSLLLYGIFGLKRTKKAIPVIPPKENMSLGFVSTLSGMYYHKGSWSSIIKMRSEALMEYLKINHYMGELSFTEEEALHFSMRTGFPEKKAKKLFGYLDDVSVSSVDTFKEINFLINDCYKFLKSK